MQKKYVVRLTDTEQEMLSRLVKQRRVSSQKVRRAQILLKANADGPNWPDREIAEAFDYITNEHLFDRRFKAASQEEGREWPVPERTSGCRAGFEVFPHRQIGPRTTSCEPHDRVLAAGRR
jgi:hypothetical protein